MFAGYLFGALETKGQRNFIKFISGGHATHLARIQLASILLIKTHIVYGGRQIMFYFLEDWCYGF